MIDEGAPRTSESSARTGTAVTEDPADGPMVRVENLHCSVPSARAPLPCTRCAASPSRSPVAPGNARNAPPFSSPWSVSPTTRNNAPANSPVA